MGEQLSNVHKDGQLAAALSSKVFVAPSNTATFFTAEIDLSAASDGDEAPITNSRGGWPTNVMLTTNDAAGSSLAVKIRVYGVDMYGIAISEDLERPAATSGAQITYGTKIFREVTKVVAVNVDNGAASDYARLGIPGNTTSAIYGLPYSVRKDSQYGYAGLYDGLQVMTKDGTPQANARLSAAGDGVTNVAVAGGNVVELFFDLRHCFK